MRKLILIAIVMGCGASLYSFIKDGPQEMYDYEGLADSVIAACSDALYSPTCYDEEIPKLMDRGLSMEDAFLITSIIQQKDTEYQYCHVLGHYLASKETGKDPEEWKGVIARAPLGMCSNGAIHGAFQEKFRSESMSQEQLAQIIPELTGICEPRPGWEPTQMQMATCTHALGHLTMYVTSGDIEAAVELCDSLIPANEYNSVRQLCYDGAFMQIYQPLEPEDFALIVGREVETKEERDTFCASFDKEKFGSCISESWPLHREELHNADEVGLICQQSRFSAQQTERCLSGIFYVAMAMANLEVDWAHSFCKDTDENIRTLCYKNSATRLIETDSRNIQRALNLCELSAVVGEDAACYSELVKYATYIFQKESDEFFELCTGMPNPWQQQCLDSQVKRTIL